MSSNQVHPRILERIQEVWEESSDQLLDRQVGAYAQLCKATKALKDGSFETDFSGLPETEKLLSVAARTIHRQAIEGFEPGDVEKLEQVCERLEHLARYICHGLSGEGPIETNDT